MVNVANAALGTQNRFQGVFGEALVATLAAAAGLSCSKPDPDIGFDRHVESPSGELIRLQIKTTTAEPVITDGSLRYDLDVDAYNRLRQEMTVPGYLVLVEVRPKQREWVAAMDWGFILRRKAHYVSLLGCEATTNTSTVRVSLPLGNMLTPATLASLMERGA
jgi:hypothetical protein